MDNEELKEQYQSNPNAESSNEQTQQDPSNIKAPENRRNMGDDQEPKNYGGSNEKQDDDHDDDHDEKTQQKQENERYSNPAPQQNRGKEALNGMNDENGETPQQDGDQDPEENWSNRNNPRGASPFTASNTPEEDNDKEPECNMNAMDEDENHE